MKSIFTFILITFFTCAFSQPNNTDRPRANNDSFTLGTASSVFINDSDPNGDPISVIYYYIDGIKYTPTIGLKAIPKYGKISFKPTGEIYIDTPIIIKYTISDGKKGTDTAIVKYYRPKPMPAIPVIKTPKAMHDSYYFEWDATNFGYLFKNDSINISDSFKIVGWTFFGSSFKACTQYSDNHCWGMWDGGFSSTRPPDDPWGCLCVYENGNLYWSNQWTTPITESFYLPTIFYVARDRFGRLIFASADIKIIKK